MWQHMALDWLVAVALNSSDLWPPVWLIAFSHFFFIGKLHKSVFSLSLQRKATCITQSFKKVPKMPPGKQHICRCNQTKRKWAWEATHPNTLTKGFATWQKMPFCLFPAEAGGTFCYCSFTGFHGYKTRRGKAKIHSDYCFFFYG